MALNLQDLIDIDLLAYFKSKLDLIFNTKVDKVAGKGLSSYDFDINRKTKLEGIAEHAQVNVIEGVNINGTPLSLVNKVANIPLATTSIPGLMSTSDKIKMDTLTPIPTQGTPGQHLEYATTTTQDGIFTTWVNPDNIAWFDATVEYNYTEQRQIITIGENFTLAALRSAYTFKKFPVVRLFLNRTLSTQKYYLLPLVRVVDNENVSTISYLFEAINTFPVLDEMYSYRFIFEVRNGNVYTDYVETRIATNEELENACHKYLFTRDTVETQPGSNTYVLYPHYDVSRPTMFVSYIQSDLLYYHRQIIFDVQTGNDGLETEIMRCYIANLVPSEQGYTLYNTADLKVQAFTYIYTSNAATPLSYGLITGEYDSQNDTESWQIKLIPIMDGDAISSEVSDIWDELADKADAADVYTKNEIDQMLVGAMNYRGTKATVNDLPPSGNAKGDVWHIAADGSEWAWNGSAWEEMGTVVDLSGYVEDTDIGLATNADIDAMFAAYENE